MKANFDLLPVALATLKTNELALAFDWSFTVDSKTIYVPSGYDIDGASIPRPFWPIIGSPFEPRYMAAAFAHDWAYLTHCLARPEADEVLFQFLRKCGCGLGRARIMWGAVRSCGYPAYCNGQADRAEIKRIRRMIAARPDADKFNIKMK